MSTSVTNPPRASRGSANVAMQTMRKRPRAQPPSSTLSLRALAFFALVGAAFTGACTSSGPGEASTGAPAPCTPGAKRPCDCSNGRIGEQSCLNDGVNYEPCLCTLGGGGDSEGAATATAALTASSAQTSTTSVAGGSGGASMSTVVTGGAGGPPGSGGAGGAGGALIQTGSASAGHGGV